MLILILIDGQYLHYVGFSFENGSNGQNDSLSDSHHSIENKKNCQAKFHIPH